VYQVLLSLLVSSVVEVVGIADPEGTGAVGLVEPLIQAIVQELSVSIGERLSFGRGIAVETGV